MEEKRNRPCLCECGSISEPILYIEFPQGVPMMCYPSAFLVGLNLEEYKPSKSIS